MSKIEFINEFNKYNLENENETGTKYIAVLDEFDGIEIYDYDDPDFFAQFYVVGGGLVVVNVSYCGESDEDSCSVKDDGLPSDLVGYVVGELDRLTRYLVASINS